MIHRMDLGNRDTSQVGGHLETSGEIRVYLLLADKGLIRFLSGLTISGLISLWAYEATSFSTTTLYAYLT